MAFTRVCSPRTCTRTTQACRQGSVLPRHPHRVTVTSARLFVHDRFCTISDPPRQTYCFAARFENHTVRYMGCVGLASRIADEWLHSEPFRQRSAHRQLGVRFLDPRLPTSMSALSRLHPSYPSAPDRPTSQFGFAPAPVSMRIHRLRLGGRCAGSAIPRDHQRECESPGRHPARRV